MNRDERKAGMKKLIAHLKRDGWRVGTERSKSEVDFVLMKRDLRIENDEAAAAADEYLKKERK